ncbi:TAXI family TRAP transporter solute-binding subunit [Acuticoccus sp. I52.16.1]|uniref:TAXI family TRAP transporter solute-binding subunit n=1 Tax=Acuticoccus sp. I52.16.1 TaxID=2928472 RepID=UPI001FD4053B|nr:TAXI family TRAP transporter solute-binding subunit [Acuticoccus sp. I52.16.1]UOM32685.1 ABC transporter substrate-binding protein [Acuticoccus sp. I52.16.1]
MPSAVTSLRVAFWSSIVLSVLAVVTVAWLLVDPAPPQRMRIATGIEDGFYDRLGRRFAFLMRREGVEVELIETAGSRENLDLLTGDAAIDAAFVQGGVGSPPPPETPLRSLAALAIEPLWVFSRDIDRLSQVETREAVRFAIGAEGSGTRQFMFRLLAITGLDGRVETLDLDGAAAADALRSGTVDLVAYVTSPKTPWVRDLLADPAVRLVEFDHVGALTRRLPFATPVELPARVIDYPGRIPQTDTTIMGVATVLMVKGGLHPAVKQLLLQVSTSVARGDAVLGTRGEFPSAELVEYPLDTEAERYFRYGPTPARRYLPFWAANLVERFWVLVIPLATLLIPVLRFGPSTLQWSIRRRIYRWYRDLRDLEAAAGAATSEAEVARVLADLAEVEKQVSEIRVPLAFRDDVYRLRTHVAFVREELTQSLAR